MSEAVGADQVKELNKQLLDAAKENNLALLEKLVRQGAQASYEHHEDGTWGASEDDCPMRYAIKHLNIDMVRFLLENGAKTTSKFGSTDWRGCGSRKSVFEAACEKRNPELLRLFLKFGADPNTRSSSQTSSMRTSGSASWALVHSGIASYDEVKILLEAGADPNSLKKERYSNERGYNSTVVLSPLHLACQLNEPAKRLRTALLLLKHKADINAVGTTTNHIPNPEAANATTDDPRSDGFISDVTCAYKDRTALHLAIEAGDIALVYALLLRGADPTVPCKISSRQPTLTGMINKDETKSCFDLAAECPSPTDSSAIRLLLEDPPTVAKVKGAMEAPLNSQAPFVAQLLDVILEYM